MSKKIIASECLLILFLSILGSEKAEAYNGTNRLYNDNELTSTKELNRYSPNYLTVLKINAVVELSEKHSFPPTVAAETVVSYRNGGRNTMNTVTVAINATPIRFIRGLTSNYSTNNFIYATNMGRKEGRSIDVKYIIVSSTGTDAQNLNFGISANPNATGWYDPLFTVGSQGSLDQLYVMDNTTTSFINNSQKKTYRTASSSLLRPGIYQLPGLTYEYTTPSIFTNKKGVKQSETAFVFNVNQSIPNLHRNSPPQLNLLNFRITDIDSRLVLETSQIRVFDSTGVDVSHLFNITTLNGVVDVNWRGTELLSLSGKNLSIRLPVNFPIPNYTESQLETMYDSDKKVFTFENINASRSYRVGNQAVRQAWALKDDEIDLAYAQRNLKVNFLENQTNNVLEPAITNAFFQRTVSLTAWRDVVEKDKEILELKYRINPSRSPSYGKPNWTLQMSTEGFYSKATGDRLLSNLLYKKSAEEEYAVINNESQTVLNEQK